LKHGYIEFQSPILITAACEGGSTLFELKYFDRKAYLTQSWQLYAEAAIYSAGKIFTIAPSFRAEKSRTRRHLTEYWHIEAEEPWCDLECLIKVMGGLIIHILHILAKELPEELKIYGRDPKELLKIKPPLKRLTYDKAVDTLKKGGIKTKWGEDLTWEQQKELSLKFKTPFFITHFPKAAKAFYHKPDPKRPEVTTSVDLQAPEGYGELIGGGQRIHDLDELLKRIKEEKLDTKDYQWYIDLRKYGSVPHAGFGLGLERLIMWICKLDHIRDAIPFPRTLTRIYP
jgi:asparaginyl-tRNA synthetase